MLALDGGRIETYRSTGRLMVRIPIGLQATRCDTSGNAGYCFAGQPDLCISESEIISKNPLGSAGGRVNISERLPYGKVSALPVAEIVSVSLVFVEDISDEEIGLEGFPSWTQYAFEWNRNHKKMPWDLNPLCWLISIKAL